MRLLRVEDDLSLHFEEFLGSDIPEYAILSHTWEKEEVSYKDFTKGRGPEKGYEKIRGCARQALNDGLRYIWVDTCCTLDGSVLAIQPILKYDLEILMIVGIDKRSSAELTEAINSMYAWYCDSHICYAYLADVPATTLQNCRWLTRGWTLQELIAPRYLKFYGSSWQFLGSKREWCHELGQVTGIADGVLKNQLDLRGVAAAVKMGWASNRTTTRLEDEAYCLLGLFDVNLPLLYGEGSRAFARLQEAILHRTNDSSLLAWADNGTSYRSQEPYVSALASSARLFGPLSKYTSIGRDFVDALDIDKREAQFRASLRPLEGASYIYEATFSSTLLDSDLNRVKPAILLLNISELNEESTSPHQYVRVKAHHLDFLPRSKAYKKSALTKISLINPVEPSLILMTRAWGKDLPLLFGISQRTGEWYLFRSTHFFRDCIAEGSEVHNYAVVWRQIRVVAFLRLDEFSRPLIHLGSRHLTDQVVDFCLSGFEDVQVNTPGSELNSAVAGLEWHLQRHSRIEITARAIIKCNRNKVGVGLHISPNTDVDMDVSSERATWLTRQGV